MPEPTRVSVKSNLRLLPVLVVFLFALELLWSERVWMMLTVALGGMWLIDFLWARSLARGLRFRREQRYGLAQVGDHLEERFTLSNRGKFPALWVEVIDHSKLTDYQASLVTGVGIASENTWYHAYTCTHRGAFTLGPTTLRTGTPFSLYEIEIEYSAHAPLLVTPPVVPLPEIRVAAGGRAYEGRRRMSTFERTVNASGVRDYVPGDPYKAIHWRTVAHRDDLMVRTFESTPAGDWWIWLDLDANAQAGEGDDSTVEHGVILAASLAERGMAAGHAVGVIANAQELVWLPPQSAEIQRLEILRALATVEPGPRSLAELLTRVRQSLPRDASVLVITPAVQGDWLDAVLAQANSTLPTILLLDPASYGGSGNTAGATALLSQFGIPHYVVTQALLKRTELRPGRKGIWEWDVTATGRAIARHAPREQVWRTLA